MIILLLTALHINGSLTQGENIADLGGIVMGYEAFKKTCQYKNKEIIAGPGSRSALFPWIRTCLDG